MVTNVWDFRLQHTIIYTIICLQLLFANKDFEKLFKDFRHDLGHDLGQHLLNLSFLLCLTWDTTLVNIGHNIDKPASSYFGWHGVHSHMLKCYANSPTLYLRMLNYDYITSNPSGVITTGTLS